MAPEGGEPTLLCTGRAHNRERHQTRTHTRAERVRGRERHADTRAISFSLSRARSPGSDTRACSYALAIAESAELSRARARLRTCMRRMLTGVCVCVCASSLHVHALRRAVSVAQASTLLLPVTSRRALTRAIHVGAYVRERVCEGRPCAYTRGDNAMPRRTQLTRRLRAPRLVPRRGTLPHLHTIRYERATRQAGSAQN